MSIHVYQMIEFAVIFLIRKKTRRQSFLLTFKVHSNISDARRMPFSYRIWRLAYDFNLYAMDERSSKRASVCFSKN